MRHIRVPPHWDGHQALATVTFLEAVIAAIWRQHGQEMAQRLEFDLACRPRSRRPRYRARPTQPPLPIDF